MTTTPNPTRRPARPLAVIGLAALLCFAAPRLALAQTRGELLYNTHCLACHSSQMHWREKKQVTDWPSLMAQVRRWQAAGQLRWSDDDVEAVTRYLNDLYYRVPPPARQVAWAAAAPTR